MKPFCKAFSKLRAPAKAVLSHWFATAGSAREGGGPSPPRLSSDAAAPPKAISASSEHAGSLEEVMDALAQEVLGSAAPANGATSTAAVGAGSIAQAASPASAAHYSTASPVQQFAGTAVSSTSTTTNAGGATAATSTAAEAPSLSATGATVAAAPVSLGGYVSTAGTAVAPSTRGLAVAAGATPNTPLMTVEGPVAPDAGTPTDSTASAAVPAPAAPAASAPADATPAPPHVSPALTPAAADLPITLLQRSIDWVQQYITIRIFESVAGGGEDVAPLSLKEIAPPVEFLGMLNDANEEYAYTHGARAVSFEKFYNTTVSEDINLHDDFGRWMSARTQSGGVAQRSLFSFCAHSFILDAGAKASVLSQDAEYQQSLEYRNAMFSALFSGSRVATPFFVLSVRRDHVVEDTLTGITAVGDRRILKKPLKVREGPCGTAAVLQSRSAHYAFFMIVIHDA